MKSTLIVLLLLLVGCGGPMTQPPALQPTARIFTASEIFNPIPGDVWTFQSFCNNATQTTTITVEVAPDLAAGTFGRHIILHFTKTDACAYWALDVPQAEDRFLLFQLPDGAWRGVADITVMPQSCPWCAGHTLGTLNWRPIETQLAPYLIVPGALKEGDVQTTMTQYHWWLLNDANTTDDIAAPPIMAEQGTDMGFRPWKTEFSVEPVDTPAYKGLAVVSHQFEGDCGPVWCNEEAWYFAPRDDSQHFSGGLVQIIPLGVVPAPADPRTAIKRTK